MTTVSTIQGNVTGTDCQSSTGLLARLLDWMNHVVDAICGPAVGDAEHDNPAAAYLFLNPSCGGAIIDTKLWDLLTEKPSQPETKEVGNV
ncbi:MAG: hypothetical protein BZY87_02760 [SAR202 cluster bacterium Io17-Chloro-G6]|nr:MAG: hypothetical protein BZY87_02760 [SAR202 cluster bacterium Io17-Chloro-G6]